MKELIRILKEMNPDTLNMCVIMHFDKETKELKSISPVVQATSIDELYNQLYSTREAISHFLNDLIDKGLKKGGQGS